MSELNGVSVVERMTNLETQMKAFGENFSKFSAGVQQIFKRYDEQTAYLMKAVTALVQTANSMAQFTNEDMRIKIFAQVENPDTTIVNIIQQQIDKNQLEEAKAMQAAQIASMEQYVKEAKVFAIDKVTEASVIVCNRLDAQGNKVDPGRIQIEFAAVYPEYRDRLIGQSVGAIIEDTDGSKMVITEVYGINHAAFMQNTNNNTSNNLPN